jgi:hypothetical protein
LEKSLINNNLQGTFMYKSLFNLSEINQPRPLIHELKPFRISFRFSDKTLTDLSNEISETLSTDLKQFLVMYIEPKRDSLITKLKVKYFVTILQAVNKCTVIINAAIKKSFNDLNFC